MSEEWKIPGQRPHREPPPWPLPPPPVEPTPPAEQPTPPPPDKE